MSLKCMTVCRKLFRCCDFVGPNPVAALGFILQGLPYLNHKAKTGMVSITFWKQHADRLDHDATPGICVEIGLSRPGGPVSMYSRSQGS
jgi:hypothetical protein